MLTHELFHLAARADTAPDAPRWLVEGVADFVARPPTRCPPVPPRTPHCPATPTSTRRARAGDGLRQAWWFARFVADDYGLDALRRSTGRPPAHTTGTSPAR